MAVAPANSPAASPPQCCGGGARGNAAVISGAALKAMPYAARTTVPGTAKRRVIF